MSPTRSEPCSVPAPHRQDPATRLGAAAARYLDALHHAAEHLADPEIVASEQAADSLLSGLAGGPLPWLPGIPDRIAANPNWGPYLDARSHLVAQLADQIHLNAKGALAWAHAPLPVELIADVQVWWAVTHVDPGDLRPPDRASSTTSPEFSKSDLTSDSPLRIPMQTCDGGNCLRDTPLARLQTHSCRSWQKG
jgi:hypothetical protein